jgi:WD40 repeat protein
MDLVCEIQTPHEEKMNGLCVVAGESANDDTVWSTSDDQSICVWRCVDFACIAKLDGFHKKQITGATCVGKQVWSYGWESDIHIWDAKVMCACARVVAQNGAMLTCGVV